MKYLKLFFIIALLTFTLNSHAEKKEPSSKYRIGAILPLTGDAAYIGEGAKNSMLLALDTLPSEERARIELHFEDDGLMPSRTVSAFTKLTSINSISALVCMSSSTCNAIAPLAEARKIPTIAIASDVKVSKGRNYVVTLWVTPEKEAEVVINEASKRGYKNIAIITTEWDGGLAQRNVTLELAQKTFNVVFNETVTGEVKDFRSLIAKIKRLPSLDAVQLILAPGQSGIFAKQLRQQGVRVPLFGYEMIEDKSEVENSSGALIGTWYATQGAPEKWFTTALLAKYPDSSLLGASNTYDALRLFSEAIKKDSAPESVAHYLRTVKDYTGATGKFSATGDNRYTLPATLKVVTKEGFELLNDEDSLHNVP